MLELLAKHRCFDGEQRFYKFQSVEIGLPMRFGIFLPSHTMQQGGAKPDQIANLCPGLVYLAGLTCTEETAVVKAGAQRLASKLGLMLITPDTSPRGAGIEGESAHWDFGVGAGFYLDATQAPWSKHYRMESHLIRELLPMLQSEFGLDKTRTGITGHSMGGHGALTLALRNPGVFKSLSAFAPIASPTRCPWGKKAFTGYLGEDQLSWETHDASCLMSAQTQVPYPNGILIDQGLSDQFLDNQLQPHWFEEACQKVSQPLTLRRHEGFDHGYYFISSFIEDHMKFHAQQLVASVVTTTR